MNPKIAFIAPVVGIPHQKYLYHRYQAVDSPDKIFIGFWRDTSGWVNEIDEYILVSRRNLLWRAINKINQKIMKLYYRLSKQYFIPVLPVEWKRELTYILRKENIKALIIYYAGLGVAMLPLLKATNIPFIVTFEGSDAQISDSSKVASYKLNQLWHLAYKNIFVSKFLKDQALERGCPQHTCKVIYNAVAIPDGYTYTPMNRPVRLICIASLLPVKGHMYLLKAIQEVMKEIQDIELYLIGDGFLFDALSRYVNDHGLDKIIHFLGILPWESAQNKLQECNIYVQTSIRAGDGQEEGLSFSVIEAQSKGLPAVVFASGGLKEVVEHNVTGFLIPEKDVNELAKAIITLSTDHKLHKKMSRASYDRMSNIFNMDKQRKEWNSICKELENY